MRSAILRFVAVALIGTTATSLGACASGARATQMTASAAAVAPVQAGQPGYQAFRVGGVSGGSDTNPLWMSNVSTAEFKTALEASLKAGGHLAEDPAAATYEVSAQMLGLDRPAMGLDFSVESSVRYKAVPVAGGAPLVDDQVQATGVGKMSEQLIGVERLRLANEKSIRTNIEQFIAMLRDRLQRTQTAEAAKPIS